MTIVSKLKKYRNLRRLTQEELSKESGISIRTIQRIEKGLSTGSYHTIKTLASTLHVESDLLLNTDINHSEQFTDELGPVKLMNLSILTVIIIPFGNLIFPTIFFLFNGKTKMINTFGRKIISLQIINTLLMFFIAIILYTILGRGTEIIPLPLTICYVIYAFISSVIVIYTAIALSNGKDALKFVPSLL